MQLDPIKPTLKAPGSKRLKLQYEKPPANSAFRFNLRRYNLARHIVALHQKKELAIRVDYRQGLTLVHF